MYFAKGACKVFVWSISSFASDNGTQEFTPKAGATRHGIAISSFENFFGNANEEDIVRVDHCVRKDLLLRITSG
ncbi:hypothetical protein QG37_06430 [Candidozyma auris]|nr:hypothetical protein QG37_06430 [[Candida] auris]